MGGFTEKIWDVIRDYLLSCYDSGGRIICILQNWFEVDYPPSATNGRRVTKGYLPYIMYQ